MSPITRPIRFVLAGLVLAALLTTTQAMATQAGFRRLDIPATAAGAASIPVALYYPTQAPERTIPMGPFTATVAMSGKPDDKVKGLIVLSHGTGGSELGHGSLAEALARHGYLVAALRHPGDNWQDLSLRKTSPERYFAERPRQASQVLDALLKAPEWKDRIASDARGPRAGALGHSAGGYTVLALAGAQPDVSRIATHCRDYQADDPIFCGIGHPTGSANPATAGGTGPSVADARIRAVVAMAPVGVVFGPGAFADVRVPALVYSADKDRFLVPRFHAAWVGRNLPGAKFHSVPNALHFAFMDTPSYAIATEDGDVATDLPGFNRQLFLRRLQRDIPAFFDKAFQQAP